MGRYKTGTSSKPNLVLITAGRLIDGVNGQPIEKGAVLIEGSTIRAAGRPHDVVVPENANADVFDFPDATIMPGMVDCHTHHVGFGDGRLGEDVALLPDEVLTLQAARNARASLFSGVTTIRENGPKNLTMFRLRDAMNAGVTVGPRMILCGRPLATIGGHMGYFGSIGTGTREVRAATRQLIKEGADYIKIAATGGTTKTSFPNLPSFNVNELSAITEEAGKFGKLTASHCASTQGIVNSLEAGVDMIIHCVFKEPDGSTLYREDVAERIGRQDAYINPTIHVVRAGIWSLLQKKMKKGLTEQEYSALELGKRELENRLKINRRLIEIGIKVITGSDSSWSDYRLGNTVYETECLVMAGMSRMTALKSVTSEAAKALGVDGIVGTLKPGKEADILILDGNPADDVNALWNIREIYKSGIRVRRGSDTSRDPIRQLPPDTEV